MLAWSDPRDSASLPADGLPLVSYPLGGKPATLPSTSGRTPSVRDAEAGWAA